MQYQNVYSEKSLSLVSFPAGGAISIVNSSTHVFYKRNPLHMLNKIKRNFRVMTYYVPHLIREKSICPQMPFWHFLLILPTYTLSGSSSG